MKRLALFVVFLAVFPVRATELTVEQIIALMERGHVTAKEATPAVTAPGPKNSTTVHMPPEEFRLEQLIALAKTHDARLAPYSSVLKLAQLRSDAFNAPDNPELRVGTELGESDPNLAASVRFFPRNPWALSAEKGENTAMVEEETAAYRSALLETTLQVVSDYHELQCLEKEKALYKRLAKIKMGYANRVDQQLAASVGTQIDGLLAHWDAQETLDSHRDVIIQAEQFKHSLVSRTGKAIDGFNIAPLDDMALFAFQDAETVTMEAMRQRPELQLLQARRAAADARLLGTKAEAVPWLNHIEVGYRNKDRGWQLEAAFNLPVFTLGGTEKMLAYEEVALRDIEIETQEQMIRLEVDAAVKTYNHAVREWRVMQERQVPLVQRTQAYLDSVPGEEPLQMKERMALEEKLIRAEVKMLDIRRRINESLLELIAIVGKPG
jgi:hypothetical protein